MRELIHSTAIVSEKATIGENVTIGPFSIINDDVVIGDNTEIRSNVVLANGSRIGKDCVICNGAVIATEPQDLKFKGESTYAYVGDRTVVREFATINRGTDSTGITKVGSDCLVMTYSHVAHDCVVGDHVIMSNLVQLAGHVTIQDWVVLGGVAKVHQFCTVGAHSMIGADVLLVKDVAPYTLIGRKPPQVEGINKVGLRRRGFENDTIVKIQSFFDTLLFSGFNNRDGIANYKSNNPELIPEVADCISFIEKSTRGIYR